MGTTVIVIIAIVIIVMIVLSKQEQDSSPVSDHSVTKSTNSYVTTESKNTWDDLHVEVVGGFYRSYEAKQCIKKLLNGDKVYFLPEPSNPYDKNAIMVISETGLHIGYIERLFASDIKIGLKKFDLRGWVYGDVESSYRFDIIIDNFCNIEKRDNAIRLYQERQNEILKHREKEKIRWALNVDERIAKSKILYDNRMYGEVESMLKPIFDAKIQDVFSYELLIKALHAEKKYEEEEKIIDDYLILNNATNSSFWKRRKFHILRATGIIISDDQIESERVDVETTVLELDAFNIVVDILSEIVDINRVDFRDAKSLFAVNFDGNTRKPICKFYLNNINKMYIGIIYTDKSVLKKQINSLDDIRLYSEELKDTVLNYLDE